MKKLLVRDSRGKPSWTLTFCVISVLLTLAIVIFWLLGLEVTKTEAFQKVVGLLDSFLMMTVGAFIAREVVEKSRESYENVKNGKNKVGNRNG